MVATLQAEAPVVDTSLEWIWRAWRRLSHDRTFYSGGMGAPVAGRIPWSVVRQWCKHHRLQRGEMDMLDLCFGEMDAIYINHYQSQQKEPAA